MKRAFLDTPEGQIHYCFGGSGEPLLLLHGTPRSVDDYLEVIPILVESRKVIAMDTIGYGDSYKPNKIPSIEDYAKTVILLLDALKIKKISIVGHHTGALIGIEVAAAYPERVEKLILSGPLYVDEDVRQIMKGLFKQWQVKEDGSHFTELWDYKKHWSPWAPPALLHRLVLDTVRAGEISEYGHYAVAKYDMKTRLPLVQCPTLIIWGSEDLTMFSIKNRPKVGEAIRQSKVVEIEGGTFLIMQQMPEKFAQLVLDSLSDPNI